MYPPIAEKAEIAIFPARLPNQAKQIIMRPVAHTKSGNTTVVRLRYIRGTGVEMLNSVEKKEWWEDLHIRHTIRICASGLLLLIGVGDILLNIFGVGYWDMFSDLIWVIGSLGILGASTYMAIDMNGE